MKACFRACLIENAFTGETVASVSIDIEFPVGSGRAHFVSKSGQLLEGCERVCIAVKHENLG
jgi:hypothetical protein